MTRFRTVDLLVTVLIGAAFGVAFLGYGQLYTLIGPLTAAFKPAEGLLAGIWFLPAMLAGLIVRKPGAALLAEMIAAVLSMLLGSQWGWGTAISGLMQGGGVELAFLSPATGASPCPSRSSAACSPPCSSGAGRSSPTTRR